MVDIFLVLGVVALCVVVGLAFLWFVDLIAEAVQDWRDRN